MTRSAAERPYLSIGEVLGLLLEEFPDVTISKIRFLESQGLIEPERTASGYRKFYDEDVELLRYILREQKEHFLPLRVIKDRLETPPEGLDRPPPRGIKNVTTAMPRPDPSTAMSRPDSISVVDRTKTLTHPAAQRVLRAVEDRTTTIERRPAPPDPSGSFDRTASYSRREIVAMLECDPEMVRELERFGMIEARVVGEESIFDEQDLIICEIARDFIEAGVDIRHLRAWKTGADREAGLFEQRVLPILRKRTPEARQEASELLDELSDLGSRLRTALLARALDSLRDGR
ncbi:MAG: MerR family transcriptional regulator [Actinomycetota bacterium]